MKKIIFVCSLFTFFSLAQFQAFAQEVSLENFHVLLNKKEIFPSSTLSMQQEGILEILSAQKFKQFDVSICAKINGKLRPVATKTFFPETNNVSINAEFFAVNEAKIGDFLVIRVFDEKAKLVENHFEFKIVE